MSKSSLLFGSIVVLAVFGSCMPDDTDTTSTPSPAAAPAATSGGSSASQAPYSATSAPRPVTPPVSGERVAVTEVIDGDTFRVSDGRTIRVLGIDSCEIETIGGESAKYDAERKLTSTYSGPITLTREPGVDTDQRGRYLRYVQFGDDREDLGEELVGWDHTGVYQGWNDASPEYIARLYAKDLEYALNPPSGRECGGSTSAPVSTDDSPVYLDNDDDDDFNAPDGALTGGYCGRKWWC